MNDMTKLGATAEGLSPALDLRIESVALARLIEEVRNAGPAMAPTAYNRTYHRHNR